MNKKKIALGLGIVISIVFMIITFGYYKSNNRLTIYTSNNSYAWKYAKKNMINTFDVSDSHYKYFHSIWEDFKYNEEDDGLVITSYEGISEELIIPTSYYGKKIIKIEKNALSSNVVRVFLPESVKTIEYDDFKDIEILCYKGEYCDKLNNNSSLNVKVLDDVDQYLLYEDELEFTYNYINQNEIELTNYLGNDENIIIPETINGYKVTSITFDGEGVISMFIPDTVNNISGNITSKLFNKCLIISILIIILTLVVYSLSIIFVKMFDIIDKVYIYSISLVYIFVINRYILGIRYNPYFYSKYIIYSIIVAIIYLIIIYVMNIIIKNNYKYDYDIKHKDDFIKEVKLLLNEYDYNELNEIKDMIKYSDPVSIKDVIDIEDDIKEELKNINSDNLDKKVEKVKKLIIKRNTIIKNNK